jgi:hypothetical protein
VVILDILNVIYKEFKKNKNTQEIFFEGFVFKKLKNISLHLHMQVGS